MALAAKFGTTVFIATYSVTGDHFHVTHRDGIIGVYANINTAKKAGKDFLEKYYEKELAGWYPPAKTKEDRLKVDKEWDKSEWTDGWPTWHIKYSTSDRGLDRALEARVEECLVE
ncbi:hypothetical protein G7Y79_00025g057950 [Physcia stellaris]|nr:hypothetical protein G7Y79_00025g057950 [Physcia stellaris]